MTDLDNRHQWLAKISNRPIDQVKFFPEANAATINSIQNGILFLMAFWSGGAQRAFRAISEVLATAETESLELVVADVDASPLLYEIPEFKGLIHGWGETAWVYRGKIIATSGLGLNVECFEPNTSTLLGFSKYGSQVTPTQIAAEFHWLPPWEGLGDVSQTFDMELAKELSGGHCLHGLGAQAIAKRIDCDDVLFAIDGEKRLAVVHLTWSENTEQNECFPATDIYADWQDWVNRRLLPDHRSYRETAT